MLFMKSKEDVEKNSGTWRKSLKAKGTKRKILATVNDSLDGSTKEMTIIRRFQFLAQNEKSRNWQI